MQGLSEFWNIDVYNKQFFLRMGPKPDMNFPYDEHAFYIEPSGNSVQYFWHCILVVTYLMRSDIEFFTHMVMLSCKFLILDYFRF